MKKINILKVFKKNNSGFTLMELILYSAILVVISGFFVGILFQVLKVSNRQTTEGEVASQINLVMQTINLKVKESSVVDIPAGIATSTLVLRMSNPCSDIIKIYSTPVGSINAVMMDVSPAIDKSTGFVYSGCSSVGSSTQLTTKKINIGSLLFTKNTFYPGHDQVAIDIQITPIAGDISSGLTRAIHSAVSRVSAATFDTDLVPGDSSNNRLGLSSFPWNKIYVQNGINETLFFSATNNTANIGIGANALSNYKLYVNGNSYFNGNGLYVGTWSFSDIRFKKDIEQIRGVLNKLINLKVVSYKWKTDEFPDKNFSKGDQIGLIAQDVEKQFPELVSANNDGYKAVAYDKLSALLVEAVKEQQKQIDEQKQKINSLESRIEKLENLINKK